MFPFSRKYRNAFCRRSWEVLIIFLVLSVTVCCVVNEENVIGEWNVIGDDNDILLILGTIRFIEIEGGCWQLNSLDGTHYEPMNLPKEFQQDGLDVTVHAKIPAEIIASTCMVGSIIEIVEIKKREI